MSIATMFRPRTRGQIEWITKVHRWVYTKSGGRLGANLAGIPIVLLTTTGRKTGEARTTPLLSMRDGDTFVVVASNGGADKPPAWWLNLQAKPTAELRYGRETHRVTGAQATADESVRLWPKLDAMYPGYVAYREGTTREIPIVLLRPTV